jgi:hypothetical protein
MRAFLYTQTAGIQDLNTLVVNLPAGVTLRRALAINDPGDIVGVTTNGRAFLVSKNPNIVIRASVPLLLLLD